MTATPGRPATEPARLLFEHTIPLNRSREDAFFFLAHTFEQASCWMEGCKRVIAMPGFERPGMWLGKRYLRTATGPFHLGAAASEEVVVHFEEGRRFIIATKIAGFDPRWDYSFEDAASGSATLHYRLWTMTHAPIARYIIQPAILSFVTPRLRRSHLRMKTRLESPKTLKLEGEIDASAKWLPRSPLIERSVP